MCLVDPAFGQLGPPLGNGSSRMPCQLSTENNFHVSGTPLRT